jgi:LuxR family maltose regulon positive regulatory protein
LEALEHANLFVVSLDHDRGWYRYHHLFADLLRGRLSQTERGAERTDDVKALHARASFWFEENGHVDQAMEHAFHAGQEERVATLIEAAAERRWVGGDAWFLSWISRLDSSVIARRPLLAILNSYLVCVGGGKPDEVEESLDLAERAVAATENQRAALFGKLATVRVLIDSYRGNWKGIADKADSTLAALPSEESLWRSLLTMALGDFYGLAGDMTAAHIARAEAVRASESFGSAFFELVANLKLAITLREEGMLRQTMDLCQSQIEHAGRSGLSESGAAGWGLAVLGETLAEVDRLEEAVSLASQGVRLTFKSQNLVYAGWACACLVRGLFSSGRTAAAEQIISDCRALGRKAVLPSWVDSMITNWQIRIWLAAGEIDAAFHSLTAREVVVDDTLASPPQFDFFSLNTYLVAARFLLATSRCQEVVPLIHRLMVAAEKGGRLSRLIEAQLLQSLVLQETGQTDQALDTLTQALSHAEPHGFVRIFLDEGPSMARLLYEAVSQGQGTDYARRLLGAFPPAEVAEAAQPEVEAANEELFEPLSDRELDVLRLIDRGLSNQEIGEHLFVSVHTVKSHVKNLFAKLDAHSRTAAVNKARGLGILPPL